MTTRPAPYRHADGSNCWTKNCSLRDSGFTPPTQRREAEAHKQNFFERFFGKAESAQPRWVPTDEQQADMNLSRDLNDPDAFYDYIHDHVGEDKLVEIPRFIGTQAHLNTIQRFLDEGGTVRQVELMGYQGTVDYTPAMYAEISNLICKRLTHGYPGSELDFVNNHAAAQAVCANFFVAVRGFVVTGADRQVFVVHTKASPEINY